MIMLATSFRTGHLRGGGVVGRAGELWSRGQVPVRRPGCADRNAWPTGEDLGAVVDRADPTGQLAAAVELYVLNGAGTLAVDPDRFARVASWGPGSPVHTPQALTAALDPPTPSPLILSGDAVRMRVRRVAVCGRRHPRPERRRGDRCRSNSARVGRAAQSGTVDLVAPLTGCPCLVQDAHVVPDPQSVEAGTGHDQRRLTTE